MTIRKGIEQIDAKNKAIEERSNQVYIPEVRLSEDEDSVILRFLNDDPLDVDFHQIQDPGDRAPRWVYCKKGDGEDCELCAKDIGTYTRKFMFWAYVRIVLHAKPDGDKWKAVITKSNKTMYQEDVNAIKLFNFKFGRGQQFWKDIKDLYNEYGTWMDREYVIRRRGARGDQNVTYKITSLDKSPIPNEVAAIIGKLPSLEAIAKGVVTNIVLPEISSLGVAGETVSKASPKKVADKTAAPKKVAPKIVDKPEVEVKLPDDEEAAGE
jgi:hypothetical protein